MGRQWRLEKKSYAILIRDSRVHTESEEHRYDNHIAMECLEKVSIGKNVQRVL